MIAAARYLGCDPWVLAKQPSIWLARAIEAQNAEGHAEEIKSKMASKG